MSELKINFSDYKSSGVYFLEIDNSIIQASSTFTARLAVGFCDKGPYNRPIYISSTADCDDLLGKVNRKLERKGCFTNRSVRNMVVKAPLYLMNLLPIDTQLSTKEHKNLDTVGLNALSLDMSAPNLSGTGLFADMFDRSKFWVADENAMMNSLYANVATEEAGMNTDELHSPLFGVGNCGTNDISLIVRKAEELAGYNVTFREWYGGDDQIPYKWINPDDYVRDYFIQVIAIKGNWNSDQFETYAADPVWSAYFTKDGLKKDKLGRFLHLDSVTVLGNWTGCIIPNFYDKQNKNKSIDYVINKTSNITGLMFGMNQNALDALAYGELMAPEIDNEGHETGEYSGTGEFGYYIDADGNNMYFDSKEAAPFKVDMIGHSFVPDTSVEFMSYKLSADQTADMAFAVEGAIFDDSLSKFYVTADNLESAGDGNGKEIAVGDFVRTTSGFLGRIVRKQGGTVTYPKVEHETDASTGEITGGRYERDASGNIIMEEVPGFVFTVSGVVALGDATHTVYQVRNAAEIPDDDNYESTDAYQDFMVLGADGTDADDLQPTDDGRNVKAGMITVFKPITSIYDTLQFIPLKGLKLTNRHMPGYDKEGNIDIEAGVRKIYEMLEDPAIKRGLLNNDQLDFRYVVDTMAGGMGEECGGKVYLSRLARDKQHCTALISIPSMSDFAKSDAPVYCDTFVQGKEAKKSFNVKYIPTGGNQDMVYNQQYEEFTTITEENGAKHAGLFTPYLKYADGTSTILVPPAADVSNTFMNKFLGGDPYKTVANTNGYIINSNIVGLEYLFDQVDRDSLEPNGINPIIVKNGSNYTIYGDRTSYQRIDSDFNFLHVRELLNTIEIKCYAVLQDYVFGYNIPQTRAEIITRLSPILQTMKDAGALVRFDIEVDENNNTKEVIDNKFCIIDIGVWITQNMEKIVTRLTVNRSTTA
jgi:hypothetical protein